MVWPQVLTLLAYGLPQGPVLKCWDRGGFRRDIFRKSFCWLLPICLKCLGGLRRRRCLWLFRSNLKFPVLFFSKWQFFRYSHGQFSPCYIAYSLILSFFGLELTRTFWIVCRLTSTALFFILGDFLVIREAVCISFGFRRVCLGLCRIDLQFMLISPFLSLTHPTNSTTSSSTPHFSAFQPATHSAFHSNKPT